MGVSGRILAATAAVAAALALPAVGTSMAATSAISGRVTAATTGQPLAGVCVQVGSSTLAVVATATTASDGRYSVGVPPGDQHVAFNFCDNRLAGWAGESWNDSQAALGLGDVVHVSDGQQVSGIDAALSPGGVLEGTVTDRATGAPVSGVCVEAHQDSRNVTLSGPLTDSAGRYRVVSLPEGSYMVAFTDCRSLPLYVTGMYKDHDAPDSWSHRGDAVWVPSGGVTVVDQTLRLGAAITGSITWAHNGAPANACVGLYPVTDPPAAGTSYAGQDPTWVAWSGMTRPLEWGMSVRGTPGAYVLGGVPPGDYLLAFGCPPGSSAVTTWYPNATSPDGAAVLHLAAGQHLAADRTVRPAPTDASGGTGYPASLRFDDVSDDNVHAPAIATLADLGIVAGVAPHRYDPAGTLTRGAAATLLVRALAHMGVTIPANPPDAFTDDEGSVHESSLNALAALGVVGGVAPGKAAPELAARRGDIAVLLVRAYRVATGTALLSVGNLFTDDDATPYDAADNRAATAGMASGVSSTAFDPVRSVTRAQAATFVSHLIGRVEADKGGTP